MNLAMITALLFQAETDEVLKKLELALKSARTLHVKFSAEGIQGLDKKGPFSAEGSVFLREGNRIAFEGKMRSFDKRLSFLLISDGSEVVTRIDQAGAVKGKSPSQLGDDFIRLMVRVGPTRGFQTMQFAASQPTYSAERLQEVDAWSAFEAGRDGVLSTVSFKKATELEGVKHTGFAKLWFDATNGRLVKRSVERRTEGGKWGPSALNYTETITEFILNADVPDEKFKLPEGKK